MLTSLEEPDEKIPGKTEVVLFDAYGTLFDVGSLTAQCDRIYPGLGQTICDAWRGKQLEQTWLRALMGRYVNFESLTRNALESTLSRMSLNFTSHTVEKLLAEYLTLSPFPDVKDLLLKLRSSARLAVLSNGTSGMLNEVIRHAGLSSMFEAVISAERARTYKPDPRVYRLALTETGILTKDRFLFVSANQWDVAGSKSFGFKTAWVNRSNTLFKDWPEYVPDYQVRHLSELARLAERT